MVEELHDLCSSSSAIREIIFRIIWWTELGFRREKNEEYTNI
jgi:hypothetical protein